jgi:hypothetical protein
MFSFGAASSACVYRSGSPPGTKRPASNALTALRPGRAHRSGGTCWTGRPNRSGKAAVLYHHVSRIRPGRNLDDTGRGKFRSNPPKTSRRCALNLHRFGWIDFDLHLGVAHSPDPSCDNQLASRYGGSRDQYFCLGISARRDQPSSCNNCDSTDKLCAHTKSPLFIRNTELVTKAQCQRCNRMERFAACMRCCRDL